jgi:hypothetical protein
MQSKIIEHTLADVQYLNMLEGSLKDIVMGSYIKSLEYSHRKSLNKVTIYWLIWIVFSLVCPFLGFVVSLAIHEHSLL